MILNTAVKHARHGCIANFPPLLSSWVYKNGFANFYQGLSPEKNLEIKLISVQFAGFSYAGCRRRSANRWSNHAKHSMSLCFGLARTCGVPRGRDAARRGRHEFAPDGSGRDCIPSTPVGTSGGGIDGRRARATLARPPCQFPPLVPAAFKHYRHIKCICLMQHISL